MSFEVSKFLEDLATLGTSKLFELLVNALHVILLLKLTGEYLQANWTPKNPGITFNTMQAQIIPVIVDFSTFFARKGLLQAVNLLDVHPQAFRHDILLFA